MANVQLQPLQIQVLLRSLKQKGKLVYEYNPLFNYRTRQELYKSNTRGYIVNADNKVIGLELTYDDVNSRYPKLSTFLSYEEKKESNNSKVYNPLTNRIIQNLINNKVVLKGDVADAMKQANVKVESLKNQIKDFTTDQLDFDLNHPVDIKIQPTYDGSVNLILNDDKNPSRLINSRFSVTENDEYQIPERLGNNDANLYDNTEFYSDTALKKVYERIPNIEFLGIEDGGNFKVGCYTFYFKYVDSDGNETDYIAESGVVTCYRGSSPGTIHSGWRDDNSNKLIKFYLSNLDPSYSYISVYYTRATGDIDQNRVYQYAKIDPKFGYKGTELSLTLTGFEQTVESSFAEINAKFQYWNAAKTQEIVKNRLFLGNIDKDILDYKELIDLSLRIYPSIITNKQINYPELYNPSSEDSWGYYNSKNIYYNLGYYPDEFYRFGIVYILKDNSLSEVFDLPGRIIGDDEKPEEYEKDCDTVFNHVYQTWQSTQGEIPLLSEKGFRVRDYLQIDNINKTITNPEVLGYNFNTNGVVKFPFVKDNSTVLGIRWTIPDNVYQRLEEYVKGFFIVRQKRIPTVLTQGLVIGLDKYSYIPVIRNSNNNDQFFVERFIDNQGILSEDYQKRLFYFADEEVYPNKAMLAPEVYCDQPFFNQFFTGETYKVRKLYTADIEQSSFNERSFVAIDKKSNTETTKEKEVYTSIDLINVADSAKLIAGRHQKYRARAGEAEEAWRLQKVAKKNRPENVISRWVKSNSLGGKIGDFFKRIVGKKEGTEKHDTPTNVVRGVWSFFVGVDNYEGGYGDMVNIYIPGYGTSLYDDYIDIRKNDQSEYYAISDRIELQADELNELNPINKIDCYRGDCYISQFTYRLNRNFIDPETPLNDDIVNPNTWKEHYSESTIEEEGQNIIRGDVNAVPLGTWVTLTVRSNLNLCMRGEDISQVMEEATFNHPRQFFPLRPMYSESSNKLPESSKLNKGFSTTTSQRYNFQLGDVPYIRNEFNTRIQYSNIYVSDAFQNGLRVFDSIAYSDFPKEYGSLTKILNYGGELIGVFEHGILIIRVDERAALSSNNGEIYMGANKVIDKDNITVISDALGSKWKDSVISTGQFVYGIDTTAKKIWKLAGTQLTEISSFNISSFLNYNIDLRERERDVIEGLRNVKTHYNAFKHDVMFTFYNATHGIQETAWNICYNEALGKWITFYSWLPSQSINIDNMYFSFNRDTSKYIAKLADSSYEYVASSYLTLSTPVISNWSFTHQNNSGNLRQLLILLRDIKVLEDEYDTLQREKERLGNTTDEDRQRREQINNRQAAIQREIAAKRTESYNLTLDFDAKLLFKPDTENQDLKAKDFQIDQRDFNAKYFDITERDGDRYLIFRVGGWALDKGLYTTLDAYSIDALNGYINDEDKAIDLFVELYKLWVNDPTNRLELREPIITCDFVTELVKDVESNLTHRVQVKDEYVDLGLQTKKLAITFECLLEDTQRDSLFSVDFWKHGMAGIFDLKDDIKPTHWYGRQHPFEFEYAVNEQSGLHKLLNNLYIVSNKAEPDSIHCTVTGDGYEFEPDLSNIYYRQEATKALLQANGYNISYDKEFRLTPTQRNVKSTYFTKDYERQDRLNDIYHTYFLKTGFNMDYINRTGTEVHYDPIYDRYNITMSQKLRDIDGRDTSDANSRENGHLYGNMRYVNGVYRMVVNPIILSYKNETDADWTNDKPPIVLPKSGLIDKPLQLIKSIDGYNVTTAFGNGSNIQVNYEKEIYGTEEDITDFYKDRRGQWTSLKETIVQDKAIRVRVRYTGTKLATIVAIRSSYTGMV